MDGSSPMMAASGRKETSHAEVGWLDAREFDHLNPTLGFFCDELAEVGRWHGNGVPPKSPSRALIF